MTRSFVVLLSGFALSACAMSQKSSDQITTGSQRAPASKITRVYFGSDYHALHSAQSEDLDRKTFSKTTVHPDGWSFESKISRFMCKSPSSRNVEGILNQPEMIRLIENRLIDEKTVRNYTECNQAFQAGNPMARSTACAFPYCIEERL